MDGEFAGDALGEDDWPSTNFKCVDLVKVMEALDD